MVLPTQAQQLRIAGAGYLPGPMLEEAAENATAGAGNETAADDSGEKAQITSKGCVRSRHQQ